MRTYAHYGINEFVLCVGYRGWKIKEFFLNYRSFSSDLTISLGAASAVTIHDSASEDWRVTIAETGDHTQTGGRLWKVRHYLEDSSLVCMTYGDGVANIDIRKLIEFHKEHGRIATVTGVRPPGRFGVMSVERRNGLATVGSFQEKPQAGEGYINGGFFVFDRRIWNYLGDDDRLVFEREPLARLASDNQLAMFEHGGFWQPMDTYREWALLNDLWSGGRAPWKVW
jgi:glucose-1-phosphate cytidylyltransferase